MELRQLKTFRTVASLQSFNQSAKVLNYAQSTVSDQIRGLENDLNVLLFKRMGKRVELTEAGEMLLQYTQRILDIEEEVRSHIVSSDVHQGALSIRIPETVSIYYLPEVLYRFHQEFPKIRFSFNNCTSITLQQEFQSGVTNLAFLITDEEYGAPNLVTEVLMSLPLVLVTHPESPLAKKRAVQVPDLHDETIILPQTDCSYSAMLKRALAESKVEPSHIFDFNCLESIKKCVESGTGITLISRISVEKEIEEGRLAVLPWQGNPFHANLLMIWRKDKWISPALEAFMRMVREHVKSLKGMSDVM